MHGNFSNLFASLRSGVEPWLLLFDIDGTLVDTGGKCMSALKKTAIEVFGSDGPPLDLAGSTDLGIIENLYVHFQVEPSPELTHRFFEIYHKYLEESWRQIQLRGKSWTGCLSCLRA